MIYFLNTQDGSIYQGDCRVGDRQATDAEVAAWQAAHAAPVNFVQVNSTSTPALNSTYLYDTAHIQDMMATSLYIQVNGKFPAGQAAFPWYDSNGAVRMFTSPAQFQTFASAMADYVAMLNIGQTPTEPITIS